MIIEGILTTLNDDNSPNIAAMGATIDVCQIDSDGLWTAFQLKAFESSRSHQNLKQRPWGVFHLLDNAELLARAALSEAENTQTLRAAEINGWLLSDSVRAYVFILDSAEWASPRATLSAKIVKSHQFRLWSGWNRGQYAVLELTIMATRVKWLPRDEIQRQIKALTPLMEKTAGPREWSGWNYVVDYLNRQWAAGHPLERMKS